MADPKAAAESFLKSLLSKTLRITTSDTRLFVGEFKCTDRDRNIILAHTHEYRLPSSPHPPPSTSALASALTSAEELKVIWDMTSRYLGLVVVPGEFVTRIEVEEFESQVKGKGSRWGEGMGMEVEVDERVVVEGEGNGK